MTHSFVALSTLCLCLSAAVGLGDDVNVPVNSPGRLPKADDGRELNLDFETGDLTDWTATGNAWKDQPVKGPIDPQRPYGAGKKSQHTGDYWLGGFEFHRDTPQGILTSVPFQVDAPWGSFLIGGGAHPQTRVELVYAENKQVFFTISGVNAEEMRPVVVDLSQQQGKKIFIRVVDEHSGGWGHVNFDDFRFHDKRPEFKQPVRDVRPIVQRAELYPYENLDSQRAAEVMQVPPGFQVTVAAAEPDVQQPIAMCLDDRGRVWIAEAYEYPQRGEEGKGRDRILIFEDTNQDGVLDERTVFIEGLNLVSGLEVGFGGVWVGAPPYLLFIPFDDFDSPSPLPPVPSSPVSDVQFPRDVPPGATVLLDGWGWQDTHETLNSFIWGPDGWLYGCHGVFTHSRVGRPGTPDEERIPINAGIWRYHPTKHKFEVFAHGTSNPWGLDFNEHGEAFTTACVIPHLYHVIPGARYQRQAGQHFNPHTYDDIQTIARHRHFVGNQWNNDDRRASDDLGGGHAHAGAMIYLGGAWPQEYHGQLFMNNIHGRRVNVDRLIPEGSGYAGDRAPDFLLTGDKWSQWLDMRYGPDGQVWAIDWYDMQQCHRREIDAHDRSNGRIFRISYGDVKPVQVDLQKLDDTELYLMGVLSKNEWYVRHARRIIHERASARRLNLDWTAILSKWDTTDPVQQMRVLWLSATDFTRRDVLPTDYAPRSLGAAIRLLVDGYTLLREPVPPQFLQRFRDLAQSQESPIVRLAIASALQKLPLDDRWPILEALVAHPEDADDHNLPLMYWYAMEPLAEADPQRALALAMAAGENIPILREYMVRRLGSGDREKALDLLIGGLGEAVDDNAKLTFLRGIRGALVGKSGVAVPDGWSAIYEKLTKLERTSQDFDVYLYALGVGVRFGDEQAAKKLREMVVDEAGAYEERKVAFSFLTESRDPELAGVVKQLLNGTTLRAEALKAVATLEEVELATAIVETYKSLNPNERTDARNTLASRPGYALRLLTAVQQNAIAKSDLSADLVRQLRNLDDDEVNQLLEQVWGVVRESDVDRKALISRYTNIVENPHGPKPDVELGRALFNKTCQQCHRLFGTGGQVGPDITGANRGNLEYLLSNILDPSAVMAKEYQPVVIATDTGRVITGIIKEETDSALTVQTTNELITLARNEIEALRRSDKSMMPDDLLKNFSDVEVRSLIAYLGSPGQVAIKGTGETLAKFFSGQDLSGWRSSRAEDAALWSVEDGEIVGKSPGIKHNSFLISELSLSDFRFSCEVKLVDDRGNSGIQFRSQPLSDGEVRGYQADIGKGWWGKIYEERGRRLLVDNNAEKLIKAGEWNRYEIVAVGSRVRTFVNGQPAVDLSDPGGARSGLIALQIHSGGPMEVRFRNLNVEILHQLPPYAAAGSPPGRWPASPGEPLSGEKISWKKTRLDDLFRSEGVCIADFNNDGLMDVASGSVWYEQRPASGGASAPRWVQHSILDEPAEFDPVRYSESFMNYAIDMNGNGYLDLIVVDFPGKQTWWFENPGGPEGQGPKGPWKRHEITAVTNNESPQLLDLTGNGRRELLCGVEHGIMAYLTPQSHPEAAWKINPISLTGAPGTNRFSHGLGAGDLNGNGRNDVLTTDGWWEASDDPAKSPWTFHPVKFGEPCSQMYVYDFDGDGLPDVLSASAHRFGIWWHQQQRDEERGTRGEGARGSDHSTLNAQPSTFVAHEIDMTLSQTHAVVLADINGDGLPDFVTGRRHWAHGGRDPGEDQPAVLYWYEFSRADGIPVWKKHLIDDDSGVGTQFEVADINGNGLLDIVVSNKRGTYVLEQVRE